MNDITFNTIYKRGFVSATCPPDVLAVVREEIAELRESDFATASPYNDELVGAIRHEYRLVRSGDALMPPLRAMADAYLAAFDLTCRSVTMRSPRHQKNDLWVNFQAKGENNPPHNHSGDLSFVLWVDVPFAIEDERSRLVEIANPDMIASFSFMLPDHHTRGGILSYPIPIDRTYEGKMVLFPSDLVHTVSPFLTSDAFRVSVAGNLFFA